MITQPGAAIDSFVSHSPGFYSGTFSGECCWWSSDLSSWKQLQKWISWNFDVYVCTGYLLSLLVLLSGTLAPSCQSSISQHQHGIAIILQILNDLLKAPYRSQGSAPAPSGLQSPILNTEEEPSKAKKKAATDKQKTDQLRNISGELYIYWMYTKLYSMFKLRPFLAFSYLCRWASVRFNRSEESNTAL